MLHIGRTMQSTARCLSVCLSTCPSQTVIVLKRLNIHCIIKLFSPSDSHAILVFPQFMAIFWQGPPNGGVECIAWGINIPTFHQYLALSWKWYKKMVIVTMEYEYETVPKLLGIILNDFEGRLTNSTRYRHSYNEILKRLIVLYTPSQGVLFRMTSSAVSLRQLIFVFGQEVVDGEFLKQNFMLSVAIAAADYASLLVNHTTCWPRDLDFYWCKILIYGTWWAQHFRQV